VGFSSGDLVRALGGERVEIFESQRVRGTGGGAVEKFVKKIVT
jgi:hypothetical protein